MFDRGRSNLVRWILIRRRVGRSGLLESRLAARLAAWFGYRRKHGSRSGAAARLNVGRSRQRCATVSGGEGRRTSRLSILRGSIRLWLGRGERGDDGERDMGLGWGYGERERVFCGGAWIASSGELLRRRESTRGTEKGMLRVLTTWRSSCGGLGRREVEGTGDRRRPELPGSKGGFGARVW